jgi:hypothetical protein
MAHLEPQVATLTVGVTPRRFEYPAYLPLGFLLSHDASFRMLLTPVSAAPASACQDGSTQAFAVEASPEDQDDIGMST